MFIKAAGLLALLLAPGIAIADPAINDHSDVPVQTLIDNANVLLAKGDMDGALDHFEAAIKRDPSNYLTIFKRGATYLSLGKQSQAEADFNAVLDLKPDWEAALVQRAKLRARVGDWDAAKKDYKAAGKSHDEDIKQLKHAEKAAKAAEKAESKKKYDECEEQASEAIKVAPAYLHMRRVRARCRLEKGEVSNAVGDLSHISAIDQSNTDTHIQIADLLFYSQNDPERALKQIKRCLHSDPESKPCKKVFRRIKNHSKAIKKIDDNFESKQFTSAGKLLAGHKDEPGLIAEVKEDVEELKKDNILNDKAPQELLAKLVEQACTAFTETKSIKKANTYCEEALQFNPDSIPALINKATRLIKEDEFDQAIAVLNKAHELDERNQVVREKLQQAQTLLRRSKQKDYYKVLGVHRDATEKEIKKAHRKLTLQYHPDKARDIPQEEAQKKMAQINEAYEVLSNPELKARFDAGDDPNDQTQQQGNPFGGGFPFGGQGGGNQFFFQQGFPGGGFPGGGSRGHNNFHF
ncbi:TPR-like protein [Ascobolus immersus RN42]|uniref:Tetratricopeptide repeat and J domain-containing co-chaperone DNJ1 n=1 Tax=Ascobolus immersus RN42 TaxID=1160509 RepID=A0A3N4HQD8_ASCIM|nr:TPR-like protein [Ascobolus immersus RN42]